MITLTRMPDGQLVLEVPPHLLPEVVAVLAPGAGTVDIATGELPENVVPIRRPT